MTVKKLTISLPAKTIKKLKEVKEETGIPVSQLLDRSFLKSEFNAKAK